MLSSGGEHHAGRRRGAAVVRVFSRPKAGREPLLRRPGRPGESNQANACRAGPRPRTRGKGRGRGECPGAAGPRPPARRAKGGGGRPPRAEGDGAHPPGRRPVEAAAATPLPSERSEVRCRARGSGGPPPGRGVGRHAPPAFRPKAAPSGGPGDRPRPLRAVLRTPLSFGVLAESLDHEESTRSPNNVAKSGHLRAAASRNRIASTSFSRARR